MYYIQYWPIFELNQNEIVGCCGIRSFNNERHIYELGFHLRKEYWGKGYAFEAAKSVIRYWFIKLKAEKLYAGHHPENKSSEKLLNKLDFKYIAKDFYKPTGLYDLSYELSNTGDLELWGMDIKSYLVVQEENKKCLFLLKIWYNKNIRKV